MKIDAEEAILILHVVSTALAILAFFIWLNFEKKTQASHCCKTENKPPDKTKIEIERFPLYWSP